MKRAMLLVLAAIRVVISRLQPGRDAIQDVCGLWQDIAWIVVTNVKTADDDCILV